MTVTLAGPQSSETADPNCEDWRSRRRMWEQTRWALELFQRHLPFPRMHPADELTSAEDDHCLAEQGRAYAIYLPGGGTTELTVPEGRYRVKWYNPRSGGPLIDGSVGTIEGPGRRPIGKPPADVRQDWAVLVVRE